MYKPLVCPQIPADYLAHREMQRSASICPKMAITALRTQVFSGNNDISNIGSYDTPEFFTENTYFYGDNFTLQRGHHLMKMGVQLLRYPTELQLLRQCWLAGANKL